MERCKMESRRIKCQFFFRTIKRNPRQRRQFDEAVLEISNTTRANKS
ncbi:hypothetical protein LINPERPRIM_LOCUS25042 [Linum perenne]